MYTLDPVLLDGTLPQDAHIERLELSYDLREDVRENIRTARGTSDPTDFNAVWLKRYCARLLKEALVVGPDEITGSFAVWVVNRGKELGTRACHFVGSSVCEEEGFTIEEAETVLQNNPLPPRQ